MNSPKIRKILGHNVKCYRRRLNMTQEQLAEQCDLSARYISYIENGKGNISVDTLEKIAKALNVESYELIKKLSNYDVNPILETSNKKPVD